MCSFNCGRPPLNTKTHYDKMAESSTHFTLHETVTTNQSRAVTDDSLQQKQGGGAAGGMVHGHPAAAHHPLPVPNSSSRNSKNRSDQYLVNENFDNPDHGNFGGVPPAVGGGRGPPGGHHSTDKSYRMSRPDEHKTKASKPPPPHAEGQSVKGTKAGGVANGSSHAPPTSRVAVTSSNGGSNHHAPSKCANNAGSIADPADPLRTGVIATKAMVEAPDVPTTEQSHRNTGAIPKQPRNKKQQQQVSQPTQPSVTKPSTNHLDEIVSLPLDDHATAVTNVVAASAVGDSNGRGVATGSERTSTKAK